jgi:SAM-dependent methyltransferase
VREEVARREEALNTFEGSRSLVGHQGVMETLARVVPAAGHRGHVLGEILAALGLEAGLREQGLVDGLHGEDVDPHRAPVRELGVGNEAGDDRRVREENPGSRRAYAVPLAEDLEAIRQVAHHVDGDDGVVGLVGERERAAGVGTNEARAVGKPPLLREPRRGGDALLDQVDAGDSCAGALREPQGRATRAAADVEQARVGAELEPLRETLELVGSDPARLPDVVAVGQSPNLVPNPVTRIRGGVERDVLAHASNPMPRLARVIEHPVTVAYDPTLFEGAATHYRYGRPPYSPQLEAVLAEELGLDGSGRLLDGGCGPGILTIRLAHLFEEAVGLDPDAAMLAEGRLVADEQGIANIRWVQAVAEDLPEAAPGPYRLITFGQSFHWTDEARVAEALYDMLEPGGALALIVHAVEDRPAPPSPGPPPIPHVEIRALVEKYLGSTRRAGQGVSPVRNHRFEDVLVRTRFGAPRSIFIPGIPDLLRDSESVLSGYFSMSSSAPHLFGDRVEDFAGEVRELLASRSPEGVFWDWPGDTEVVLARVRR